MEAKAKAAADMFLRERMAILKEETREHICSQAEM